MKFTEISELPTLPTSKKLIVIVSMSDGLSRTFEQALNGSKKMSPIDGGQAIRASLNSTVAAYILRVIDDDLFYVHLFKQYLSSVQLLHFAPRGK